MLSPPFSFADSSLVGNYDNNNNSESDANIMTAEDDDTELVPTVRLSSSGSPQQQCYLWQSMESTRNGEINTNNNGTIATGGDSTQSSSSVGSSIPYLSLTTVAEVQAQFECRRHIIFMAMKCADYYANNNNSNNSTSQARRCTCARESIERLAMHRVVTMNPKVVSFLPIPSDVLERNEYHLPTLASMYKYAYATCPDAATYTYMNADIIFDELFVPTVEAALRWLRMEQVLPNHPSEFMMAGPRYKVVYNDAMLTVTGYQQLMERLPLMRNRKVKLSTADHRCDSIDYFITTRNAINWTAPGASQMVIGRPGFDIWLIDRAYRSPNVSLITSNSTLAAGHLVDPDTGANSNSEWQTNRNGDDRNYNNNRLWAPNQDSGWLVDWGQFGYPCAAFHKSVFKQGGGLEIQPSRKQRIFFRYHPGEDFEQRRFSHWERRHQPVITSTIIVVSRSVAQLNRVYKFLSQDTVFTLFPGDKHRVDISLRIPSGDNQAAGDVNRTEALQIQYFVNEEAGRKLTWVYGQWEGTVVTKTPNDDTIENAVRRRLLVRSSSWVNVVRAGITSGLKHGTKVTSKNTIIVDSAQMSTLLTRGFVLPPSWYQWFRVVRRQHPKADGIYFLLTNATHPPPPRSRRQSSSSSPHVDIITPFIHPSYSPDNQYNAVGSEGGGSSNQRMPAEYEEMIRQHREEQQRLVPPGHQFAWTFHPKSFTEYIKSTNTTSMWNVPFEPFCMSLMTKRRCKLVLVYFPPPSSSSSSFSNTTIRPWLTIWKKMTNRTHVRTIIQHMTPLEPFLIKSERFQPK